MRRRERRAEFHVFGNFQPRIENSAGSTRHQFRNMGGSLPGRRLRLVAGRGLRRPRRLGDAGNRGKRHGGQCAAPGDRGRRRHSQARRQCDRCRYRGGVCAGRRLSGRRESGRRRVHDDRVCRWTKDLPRFSGEGPPCREPGHVPRQGRKRHQGPDDIGLAGGRRPRYRVGPGICATQIWNDDAGRADRAGDQTGRRRIYPGPGRRRQAHVRDRRFQKISGDRPNFSQ